MREVRLRQIIREVAHEEINLMRLRGLSDLPMAGDSYRVILERDHKARNLDNLAAGIRLLREYIGGLGQVPSAEKRILFTVLRTMDRLIGRPQPGDTFFFMGTDKEGAGR